MHPNLLNIYRRKILPNIEEPIRELVAALWELPFVVDTNEACSGHIVTSSYMKSDAHYEPIRRGVYWYPHGIRLGVDFSLEDGLKESGEEFRNEISGINVDVGLTVSEFERGYQPVEGDKTRVLHVTYYGNFPDRDLEPPQTEIDDLIGVTQNRLVEFWEAFAMVVRKYNPSAEVSPITGKNFLEIIDWVDLGDTKRYSRA